MRPVLYLRLTVTPSHLRQIDIDVPQYHTRHHKNTQFVGHGAPIGDEFAKCDGNHCLHAYFELVDIQRGEICILSKVEDFDWILRCGHFVYADKYSCGELDDILNTVA